MKKIFLLFSIISISMITSGCNHYFKAEKINGNNDIYYGVFNTRDKNQADVKFYKKNSIIACDGIIVFSNNPVITDKNYKRIPGKMTLGCNDGTVMDVNWLVRRTDHTTGYGKGVDQYNNIYNFTSIGKYEFVKNIKNDYKFKDIDKTEKYLKY